jgi:hypothetical protein
MLLVRWMLHRRTNGDRLEAIILLSMWIAAGITVLLVPTLARAYDAEKPLKLVALFHPHEETGIPVGLVVIAWVLYLWWRGYKLSRGYISLARAGFGMRLGILAFLWVCILAGSKLREDILPLVPIFFFFGLLSSGLARADSLNLDRAGHGAALGRGWIAALLGIALIVTLGGYAAALWLTGINMGQVAAVLGIIAHVLLTLLFLLVIPMFFLVQLAFNFIASFLPDRASNTPTDIGGAGGAATNHGAVDSWLITLIQILGVVLVVAVIVSALVALFAMIWFLFVVRDRQEEDQDEQRESLGTGEVVVNMRQTLRDSWQRLAGALGVLRQFGLGRDLFTALTIRRIYAHMEKLAGARGYPRTPSETPYEYRQELHQAFPDQDEAIERIIEAYIAVRYGEVPEDPADLEAVRAAWERLSNNLDSTAADFTRPTKNG